MTEQDRSDGGKFAAKGDSIRAVRSIRLTDSTWHSLGDKADELDITKADYLEGLFSGQIEWEKSELESDENELDFDLEEEAEKLKNARDSKERGNKHLKVAITEFLEVIGYDSEEEE